MSRLPRPTVPVKVELQVVLRQLGISPLLASITVDHAVVHRQCGIHRDFFLELLADKFGCAVNELDLDHDPAMENREKVYRKGVHVDYKPAANDPEFLHYRPHGPEFIGSHDVKTRIRGDHGSYSDAALARKIKRIASNRDPHRRKAKIRSANRWPPKGSQKIQSRRK